MFKIIYGDKFIKNISDLILNNDLVVENNINQHSNLIFSTMVHLYKIFSHHKYHYM